jgi:hypothetical protein
MREKAYLILAVMAITLAFILQMFSNPVIFGQPQQQQQFYTYRDPQDRFTMDYPSDWQFTTTSIPSMNENAPTFMSPSGSGLFVVTMPVPPLAKNIEPALALDAFMSGAQTEIQDPVVIQNIECSNYIVSGEKACSAIISGSQNNTPIRYLFVGTIINENAFYFVGTGSPSTFYSDLTTIDQMISSFQLSNQNPSSPNNSFSNQAGSNGT